MSADDIQLSLAEVKLAWIVHIVAAILKTKQISGFRLHFYCLLKIYNYSFQRELCISSGPFASLIQWRIARSIRCRTFSSCLAVDKCDRQRVTQSGFSLNQVGIFFAFRYFQCNLNMQSLWCGIVAFYILFFLLYLEVNILLNIFYISKI